MTSMPFAALPDISNPAYRDAYSRINGMVVVGENLAGRHFRLLACLPTMKLTGRRQARWPVG